MLEFIPLAAAWPESVARTPPGKRVRGPAELTYALDRYTEPEQNLRGLHMVLESLRRIERDGTQQVWEQVMRGGYAQLSGPGDELDVPPDASRAAIEAAFRSKAHRLHPDKPGGDAARFQRLVQQRDEALRRAGA